MPNLPKPLRALPLLAACCLVVLTAGCGREPETALERVKAAGEISFAMSGGYPPFNFYNESNELVGFDVDVATEVARRLGVKLKPVTTEWSGIIEGLRAGAYDGILGSMAITEERQKVVDFSQPYYYSGAQLLVREDAPYAVPAELAGRAVGLVTGTTFEGDAKALGAGEVRLYKDDTQTLLELDNGVVDAVITDRVVGIGAMNSGKFAVRLLGGPLRSEDIGVAFRKDDGALRDAVNAILAAMREDGTLTACSMRWLGVDVSVR
ncbi:ABC transporter substrate-binding protein [Desulfocurvus sp.]|jgi:polar amino acid transport system substrate-binding protein|uniref:ABC transporter substrate-binding protein n=1 Tax=Desulfocurvus sp. TaxID=2871698 RepID=UPI0025BFA6BC|nr:ABC transporter substrate-binding protein [Desulfocurvus sp.]MCK9238772.1 ABC transporter substrate-binding protein [Desulfocurvus sp.]